jgi:hypothetical protein
MKPKKEMLACSCCFIDQGVTVRATKLVPQETTYDHEGLREAVDPQFHPLTWRQVCDGCFDGWFDGANEYLPRIWFDLPKPT